MNIYVPHSEDKKIGGGWSFISNLLKTNLNFTSYSEADIFFIPSPSICSKEEVDQAESDGKKIVLRVDNIVRNSRNRNTGMSRMRRFAEQANLVVYQSYFAQNLLSNFTGVKGVVIHNSVDTNIFNPKGRTENLKARFMYSRVNRDETKNWEMARYTFQSEWELRKGNAILNIVGNYSPELVEYSFDFYQGEDYKYWGVITDPGTLASIYRDSDYFIYTYWNDACPNSLIEALCSGCIISDPYKMIETGGAGEIMHNFYKHGGEAYFGLDRMEKDYKQALESIL